MDNKCVHLFIRIIIYLGGMFSLKRLRAVQRVVGLMAIVVFGGYLLHALPSSAVTETVTGTVTESDGTTAVANAYVAIHDTMWSAFSYAYTDESGNFSIDIAPGAYTLEVWAYHATEGDPAPLSITVTDGGANDYDRSLTAKNVTFALEDTDSSPIASAYYWVYNADWTFYTYGYTGMDGSGSFSLSESGTYYMEFSPSTPTLGAPSKQTITYTSGDLAMGTITFSAPSARIKVLNVDSTPAQYVSVNVNDENYSWENSWYGSTDTEGVATVGSLDDGTYTVTVYPPWTGGGSTYIAPDPVQITVESGSTDTQYYDSPLQFSEAVKTIEGTIQFPDGTPVTNASYSGWQLDGNSYFYGEADSNGQFTASVSSGKFEMSIWPVWGTEGDPWGYTGGSVRVEFTGEDDVEETQSVAFTVAPFNSTIEGTLLDPDGNVLTGYTGVDVWSSDSWNWGTVSMTDGSFSVAVPEGTYQVRFWTSDTQFGSPTVGAVTVATDETYDLGTLNMIAKDATISGRVTDNSGNGLANQYINMWSVSRLYDAWGWAITDEDGNYSLSLIGGREVEVAAFPGWNFDQEVQYINTMAPQRVTVAQDATETLNWTFSTADAKITGAVVDEDGGVISDLYGWVDARVSGEDSSGYYWGGVGAPVSAGIFSVDVVGGYTWDLSTWMPWGAGYSVLTNPTATPDAGETLENVNIVVVPNDVTVTGSLVDGDGTPVTDIGWAEVFAENGNGGYQWAQIEDDGSYTLQISAGTWRIAYAIPFDSAYIASYTEAAEVTATSGETITLDLELLEADSTLAVTVIDPDGNPVPNAWIDVSTDSAGRTVSDSNPFGFYDRGNYTDQNGEVDITVPSGTYYVSTFVPSSESGWVAPAAQAVTAVTDETTDVAIQFLEPDVTISGTLTLPDESLSQAEEGVGGLISLYSSDGQAVDFETNADGTYEAQITSDTTWYVSAAYDDGTSSYASEQVELTPDADEEVDIDIDLSSTAEAILPDTASQTTAGENSLSMELGDSDDFTLFAGARQLSSESDTDISVTVTPLSEVPTQAGEQPFGTAMDVSATVASGESAGSALTELDGVVSLTFTYDPENLPEGVAESDISLGYFDDTAGTWRAVSNIVVNEESNTVTGTTDHFTVFSLITPNGSVDGTVEDPDEGEDDTPDDELPDDINPAMSDHDIIASPVVSGGAHYRVFTQTGSLVGDFFAYGESLRGEFHAVGADIDGDGEAEVITTAGPGMGDQVRAFEKDGEFLGHVFALDEGFRGGLNVVAADMNNDGDDEVVVIPQIGPANLRVFEYDAPNHVFDLVDWVQVFDTGFKAGSNLVTGDFDGNDTVDVAVATADNSGNVQAYKMANGELERLGWVWPYTEDFHGGVRLATGDTDNDGKHELITATEEGASNLRVFSFNTETEEFDVDAWTFVYDENFVSGMTVTSADMDGDGFAEIAVAPKRAGGPNVRILHEDGGELEVKDWIMAYDEGMTQGVNVALVDTDDDQQAELVTGTRSGSPNLRIYDLEDGALSLKTWWWAFDETFTGGVHVQY